MPSNDSLRDFFNKKEVRFALAALCLFFAANSLFELIGGSTRAHFLHGGGGVLIWGGWAVVNVLHPFGRSVPYINVAINVGLILFVASWVVR